MSHRDISDEDFLIQVVPELDDKNSWTGEVQISIVSSENSCLTQEEIDSLTFFCKMMCVSVPIYEEHDNIREMASWLIKKKYSDDTDDTNVYKNGNGHASIDELDGNVIRLNFRKDH